MNLDDVPAGESIFLDANILVYHFIPFPVLGPLCTKLIERIDSKEVMGFTSTQVISEAAHRLMTTEASRKFGWKSKVVDHLKRQPDKIQELTAFREAIEKIPKLGIQVVAIPVDLVVNAASVSIQYGLMSNDALTVAVMQSLGITHLASHDTDFDRVPGLKRYAPV